MRLTSTLIVLLSLSLSIEAQIPCENGLADIYPCDGYDLLYHYPLEEIGGESVHYIDPYSISDISNAINELLEY